MLDFEEIKSEHAEQRYIFKELKKQISKLDTDLVSIPKKVEGTPK